MTSIQDEGTMNLSHTFLERVHRWGTTIETCSCSVCNVSYYFEYENNDDREGIRYAIMKWTNTDPFTVCSQCRKMS